MFHCLWNMFTKWRIKWNPENGCNRANTYRVIKGNKVLGINLVEWAADSPISYWYLGGQYLGQPTSVDEPKIGRETLAKLFSYPLRSVWTRVSTKDTCATKMRLSQQWLFPCLNRKEYCMPRTKDLPKTDKLMQKVYEILFSVYDFIWIC